MKIKPILATDQATINKCIKLGENHYFENIVLLGDLFYPCIKLTDVYGVYDNNYTLISFFTIFWGFKDPSVVIPSNLTPKITDYILHKLPQLLPVKFILVSFSLGKNYLKNYFQIIGSSNEELMTIDLSSFTIKDMAPICKRAVKKDHNRINSFYRENNTFPWHPIQLESNFYFFIENENNIIACGGTHFETINSAQLGNILVLPEYRGRYYGTNLITSIVNEILQKKKYATLFVAKENLTAINIYKKLGFIPYRRVSLFTCSLD